jgi:hypothetical protein
MTAAMRMVPAITHSSRASPGHGFGLATGGAFGGRALIATLAGKFARALARLMERGQVEPFDDAFVANRHGGEPGDQCFDSVHVLTQPPEPTIEENLS